MAEVTVEEVSRKVRDLYNKAFSAVERGNTDYAIQMLRQVLELEPRLLIARKYLRMVELKRFRESKVNHTLATVSGLGKMMSAKGALKKNPKKALSVAEDLMEKDPANLQFVRVLEQAAVAADMPEVAIQTYEMIRDQYPQDADLLRRLGALYLSVDEPLKGRDCLELVARMNPKDQEAQKALKDASALATLKKGNWEKEGSFRDKMKDTKEAQRLEKQAKAVKSSQDLPAMIAEQQAKIEREPENVNYRRALADLYGKSKDYVGAISVLEEAQRVSDSPDPQVDQAINNYRVKQFEKDIAELQEAGDEAGAQAKTAEMEEFRFEYARECVKRYPNDLQFSYMYGELLFNRGELNDAIQQFQKAQRNPQRRTRALYYLAMCFEQKGQLDIAMEQLEKAASELQVMDETKKDVLYAMGALSEQMDEQQKAVDYYKEIYAVDIGYRDVADRIEQAYKK
jgi:tetratricopeptide (TPR) repeat protein